MKHTYKSLLHIFFCYLFLIPTVALAGADVIEGDEAKMMFEEKKGSIEILSQKEKNFILKKSDGEEVEMPEEITVEAGEYLFITNDEEKTVHNVYDSTDHSWVLKKQLPNGVAAVKFNEPKTHKLRCAIHPKMQIKVNVVEKGQKKGGE